MTGATKLGVEVLEHNGARLEIEVGYEAALKVDHAYNQDIAFWITEQANSRIGFTRILYLLQVGEQMTQKEIWEAFFADPDPAAQEKVFARVWEVLNAACGVKYQNMLPEAEEVSESTDGENAPKKTPSNSTK